METRARSLVLEIDLFRKAVRERKHTTLLLPAEALLDQCEQRRALLFGPRGAYDEDVKSDGLAQLLARIDETLTQIVQLMAAYRGGATDVVRALFVALVRLTLLFYGDGEHQRSAFRAGTYHIYARQTRPEAPLLEHLQLSRFSLPLAPGPPCAVASYDIERDWAKLAEALEWAAFTDKK